MPVASRFSPPHIEMVIFPSLSFHAGSAEFNLPIEAMPS
jgi:hypothetical protein